MTPFCCCGCYINETNNRTGYSYLAQTVNPYQIFNVTVLIPSLTFRHHSELKPDCSNPHLDSRLPCSQAINPMDPKKLCELNETQWLNINFHQRTRHSSRSWMGQFLHGQATIWAIHEVWWNVWIMKALIEEVNKTLHNISKNLTSYHESFKAF